MCPHECEKYNHIKNYTLDLIASFDFNIGWYEQYSCKKVFNIKCFFIKYSEEMKVCFIHLAKKYFNKTLEWIINIFIGI